jgi:hypothetical protein
VEETPPYSDVGRLRILRVSKGVAAIAAAGAMILASVGSVSAAGGAGGAGGAAGQSGQPGQPGQAIGVVGADWTVTLKNWPENSGWAIDQINRRMDILELSKAPDADCGTTRGACYLYEALYEDFGSFTTVKGVAYPNSSITGTEKGGVTGLLVGSAILEFYASSQPVRQTRPVTLTDGSTPSSEMFEMAFPAGTLFNLNSPNAYPGYGDFDSYQWVYITPHNGVWVDEVGWSNPADGAASDDGQGPTDGNIYG